MCIRDRPDTDLGVVVEIVRERKFIKPVGLRCIGGLRDGEALIVRRTVPAGELGKHPPVGHLVILSDDVPRVVRIARVVRSQGLPEQVCKYRRLDQCASRFIENGELAVHPLDILSESGAAVGIGGNEIVNRTVGSVSESGEIQNRERGEQLRLAGLERIIAERRVFDPAKRNRQGAIVRLCLLYTSGLG